MAARDVDNQVLSLITLRDTRLADSVLLLPGGGFFPHYLMRQLAWLAMNIYCF